MLAEPPDWAPSSWRHPWWALLATVVIVGGLYFEARFSKPKVKGNRFCLRSGYLMKVLTLLPAIGFAAIFIHTILNFEPQRPVEYLFYLIPGTFAFGTAIFCADAFVRRVVYDDRGVELVAILARRRRAFVEWHEIRQVKADFDKIVLKTQSSKFVVYGYLRGCKCFIDQLKEKCPHAEIVGSY